MKGAFGNEGALRFSKAQYHPRVALANSGASLKRKFNCKCGAFSGCRGVIDLAAMFVDDLQRVRESQTDAVSLRSEKWHKQIARLLFSQAETGVANAYQRLRVTLISADAQV